MDPWWCITFWRGSLISVVADFNLSPLWVTTFGGRVVSENEGRGLTVDVHKTHRDQSLLQSCFFVEQFENAFGAELIKFHMMYWPHLQELQWEYGPNGTDAGEYLFCCPIIQQDWQESVCVCALSTRRKIQKLQNTFLFLFLLVRACVWHLQLQPHSGEQQYKQERWIWMPPCDDLSCRHAPRTWMHTNIVLARCRVQSGGESLLDSTFVLLQVETNRGGAAGGRVVSSGWMPFLPVWVFVCVHGTWNLGSWSDAAVGGMYYSKYSRQGVVLMRDTCDLFEKY